MSYHVAVRLSISLCFKPGQGDQMGQGPHRKAHGGSQGLNGQPRSLHGTGPGTQPPFYDEMSVMLCLVQVITAVVTS